MKKLIAFMTAFIVCILSVTAAAPDCFKSELSAYAETEDTTDYKAVLDSLIRNHYISCAVLLTASDGTTLYSYNPNTALMGASLIKLPYVYYVCQQLSNGVRSLSDTFTYTSNWYHGGSGIIRNNGYGKVYTVAQLIDYALRYSDNVAYDILVYLFGIDGYNNMVTSWGYNCYINNYVRFPAVTASFMTTAIEKMKAESESGECWEICWDALINSEFSYSRSVIDDAEYVALKYGFVPTNYHEVMYVECEMPYILTILDSTRNSQADSAFIKNVASASHKMVKQYAYSLKKQAYIPGDVNDDGAVDAVDASAILTEYAWTSLGNTPTFSELQMLSADYNSDGIVDAVDASAVLKAYAFGMVERSTSAG